MSDVSNAAAMIRGARMAGGGNWIKQGKGILVVKQLIDEVKFGGATFIAELWVEKSESFPDAKNDKNEQEFANAPGSSPSFVQAYGNSKFKDTALPNMKAFLYTLIGESDDSLDARAAQRVAAGQAPANYDGNAEFGAMYASMLSPAQPCRGMAIGYETYQKETVKTKKMITLVKWSHIKQEPEHIAARRRVLDGADSTPAAAPAQ